MYRDRRPCGYHDRDPQPTRAMYRDRRPCGCHDRDPQPTRAMYRDRRPCGCHDRDPQPTRAMYRDPNRNGRRRLPSIVTSHASECYERRYRFHVASMASRFLPSRCDRSCRCPNRTTASYRVLEMCGYPRYRAPVPHGRSYRCPNRNRATSPVPNHRGRSRRRWNRSRAAFPVRNYRGRSSRCPNRSHEAFPVRNCRGRSIRCPNRNRAPNRHGHLSRAAETHRRRHHRDRLRRVHPQGHRLRSQQPS
jgi:hypothetical protein